MDDTADLTNVNNLRNRIVPNPEWDHLVWTITKLKTECCRQTMENEHGERFHKTICAVSLSNSDQGEIDLIYEDRLPTYLNFAVGKKIRIEGLHDSRYCREWGGYWLNGVNVSHVTDGLDTTVQ